MAKATAFPATGYADLVTDNGELIRIEYPMAYEDEFLDSIAHTMKRGDWFATGQWDGCKAEYLGLRLDRINMKKIVGTL